MKIRLSNSLVHDVGKVVVLNNEDLNAIMTRRMDANWYNRGVYGWNWDGYNVFVGERQYVVVGGYRNFPKEDVKLTDEWRERIHAVAESPYSADRNKEDVLVDAIRDCDRGVEE